MLLHEDVTHDIMGAAIEVHQRIGPGLLESAYRRCLFFELAERGRRVQDEVTLDLEYEGTRGIVSPAAIGSTSSSMTS